MKEVKILQSNNRNIQKPAHLNLKDVDGDEMRKLREYVLSRVNLLIYSDPDIFYQTMDWVSSQWVHDGINNAPEDMTSLEILERAGKGEKIRCVEYAKVTVDVFNALGYVARLVNIISEDADYGGLGKAHMAVEVWSNSLEKWIYLDPQFSMYATKDKIPLNYYEIYTNFDEVHIIYMDTKAAIVGIDKSEAIKKYKDFLSNYFGFMCIFVYEQDIRTRLTLHLNNPKQQLAFQYMGLSNAVYTNNLHDLYFPINQTLILFDYKEKIDFNPIFKKSNIKTLEEFQANLDLFETQPKFKLKFLNNMEFFNKYEIQINQQEKFYTNESTVDCELREGINTIKVCAINKLGVKGCTTEIQIRYE